jgi:hypothetical protein
LQVFLAMFTHQMVEEANGRVSIPDLDSKALEALLEWMYSAKVAEFHGDTALARDVLFAADKYQLDELKVSKKIISNETNVFN